MERTVEKPARLRYFTIRTFGCQMNVADSEWMSREFLSRGFEPAEQIAEADIVLVNTCTVRQHAEDRALSFIGRLHRWKKERPGRFLVVAGCAVERLNEKLRLRFPYIDLAIGAKSIGKFPQILNQALNNHNMAWDQCLDSQEMVYPASQHPESSGVMSPNWRPDGTAEQSSQGARSYAEGAGISASVPIMRGCSLCCRYCIVPAVRGGEICRDPEQILAEVKQKANSGAAEVVLLGQTVNKYHWRGTRQEPEPPAPGAPEALFRDTGARPGEVDFAELLRLVNRVEGLARIKFLSPHPLFLTDRVIASMAECEKVAQHIHLPVQSGSNRILRLMKRGYTRELFLEKAAKLREAIPGIALTTDIIVGFPSESEEEFEETLSLIRKSRIKSAFCFKFSPREGTGAEKLPGQVSSSVKEARLARLLSIVKSESKARIEEQKGNVVEVLMRDHKSGRTSQDFRIIMDRSYAPGSVVPAVVSFVEGSTLLGSEAVPRSVRGTESAEGMEVA